MFIFGGYVRGGKSNDLWRYDFEANQWNELEKGDYLIIDPKELAKEVGKRPAPRIGAAIIQHKNSLYLFGGHDENNEKLGDLWEFSL